MSEWKMVPVEPTEAEIDAPRDFLLGLELGINKTATMREHLDRLGTDYSFLPDWFKTEDTHLTKAGKAICIRAFMLSATPQPTEQEGWKLTPHQPDKNMIAAGIEQWHRIGTTTDAWQAMWHAAPNPTDSGREG